MGCTHFSSSLCLSSQTQSSQSISHRFRLAHLLLDSVRQFLVCAAAYSRYTVRICSTLKMRLHHMVTPEQLRMKRERARKHLKGLILCTTKLWRNDFSVRFFLSLRRFFLFFPDFILFPHRTQITTVTRNSAQLCIFGMEWQTHIAHTGRSSLGICSRFAPAAKWKKQNTERKRMQTKSNFVNCGMNTTLETTRHRVPNKLWRRESLGRYTHTRLELKCIQLTTTLNILHMFFHSLCVVISLVASHRVRAFHRQCKHTLLAHHPVLFLCMKLERETESSEAEVHVARGCCYDNAYTFQTEIVYLTSQMRKAFLLSVPSSSSDAVDVCRSALHGDMALRTIFLFDFLEWAHVAILFSFVALEFTERMKKTTERTQGKYERKYFERTHHRQIKIRDPESESESEQEMVYYFHFE